jgi:hypothetical protein
MTMHNDPDDILAAWLDEGPRDLPSSTRRAIATSLSTTKQTRRGLLAPWRLHPMSYPIRPALGVAAVVIAIAGTAIFLRGPSGIAPPAASASPEQTSSTPSYSPAANASEAPTTWPRYTSMQYAFSIGHPSDWTVQKALRPWSLDEDAKDVFLTRGADGFLSADEYLYVNAWMAPLDLTVEDGSRETRWLAAVCPSCADETKRPVEVDGHPGTMYLGETEAQAFVFMDDKVYGFAVWRAGYEGLLAEFLSTVKLP